MINPCKTCEVKKWPTCQKGCERYKKWLVQQRAAAEAMRKAEIEDHIYWSVRNTGWDER